jgi:superfamily II DNA or RNA helicase
MARLLGQVTEHLPRTQAVGEIVMGLVKDKNRRVLILSERKVMLEALEAFFADTGIHVGYYIGGMKEKDRNHAGENAQILLGTYSMASEGMSIKTLNTIVLASPRKKVEQSVGRILRQRPEERTADPLIVDIVDCHGIYQGQYRKRRVFYKQCGYKIQVEKIGQGSEGNEGPEEADSDHETANVKTKKAKASKGKPAVTDFDFVNDSEEDA